MANNIGWGQAHENNDIGYGQGGVNNTIEWAKMYKRSNSGETVLSPEASPFIDSALALSLRDLGLGATNVVRVRRSTDNAEQDFTANEFENGTLESFVGAGNDGFVSVWYDQLGINNMTQTSASKQPSIVSNGVLNILNGKPIIKRVRSEDSMVSEYSPNGVNRQVYFVGEMTYSNNQGCLIGSQLGGSDYNMFNQQASTSNIVNNSSIVSSERLNGNSFNYNTRGDIYNSFLQQRLLSYDVDFNFDDNFLCLGYRPKSAMFNFGMYDMQELILFEETKDQLEIENKINEHYGIY